MPRATGNGSGKNYPPCPEGVTQGVLVDVIDLGVVSSTFNGETKQAHKVNLVYQVNELRDDGKRFTIYNRVTLSLHAKAALRKIAETLRGKKFTEEEIEAGFELDNLKGANALLTIIHNPDASTGRVYANIAGVAPLMKNMPPIAAEGYERRGPKVLGEPGVVSEQDLPDDDIPF